MRARSSTLARWASVALACAVAVALLAACAPTTATRTTAVVKRGLVVKGSTAVKTRPLYRKFEPYPGIRVVQNLRYGTAAGVPLELDFCLPSVPVGTAIAPRPAIVSIHGGSWAHGDKASVDWRNVCQWLASEGYVTASVGYRLAPAAPYPAAISDIRTAVRWLRAPAQVARYSIDPTLIGAFGGSAGGNLAALLGTAGNGSLASGARVAAVAELSGPSDLTAAGAELPDFEPYVLSYLGCASFSGCADARAASPLYQANKTDPPFFIAHSSNERIPLAQSTALVAKLKSVGVATTFVEVNGSLHSIAMLDQSMRNRVASFFHAKLVHASTSSVG